MIESSSQIFTSLTLQAYLKILRQQSKDQQCSSNKLQMVICKNALVLEEKQNVYF